MLFRELYNELYKDMANYRKPFDLASERGDTQSSS